MTGGANEEPSGLEPDGSRSLSDGFLATVVVVVPASLFAELWRGKPIIDQGHLLWLIPASVMALGFLVGGAIAGRRRHNALAAFEEGLLAALMAVGLIFVLDMIRRLVYSNAVPLEILGLWAAAAAAALVVGGLGGVYGRLRGMARRGGSSEGD